MTAPPLSRAAAFTPPPGMPPALEMKGVDKAFDGKMALENADITLQWGEVHALVGENGAGKSTLMNIATGVYAADDGEQTIDGSSIVVRSPLEATAAGLGMVHQHFRLVETFTVAENVLLALGKTGLARSVGEAAALIARKSEEIGLPVDPHRIVADLSTAERQRAEIIKVLLLGARILVLDEPTAVLTEEEGQALLGFVQRLAQTGHAVILITHKFREVSAWCDRVTIMRHGRTVLGGAAVADLSAGDVARMMVGEMVAAANRPASVPGETVLELRGLLLPDARQSIDIELRAGEVLGVAGVGGNGQEELVACLLGTMRERAGEILLHGSPLTRSGPHQRRRAGFRFIPADRFATGLTRDLTVAENLALTTVGNDRYGSFFLVDRKRMQLDAETAIEKFDIRGAGPSREAGLLSGGNAQKVLLARELDEDVSVLIAHSPSRGLDIKSTQFVRDAIRLAVERGAACLLISEDLQEVLSLSHRVAVMNRGSIAGIRDTGEVTSDWIGTLLAGHA